MKQAEMVRTMAREEPENEGEAEAVQQAQATWATQAEVDQPQMLAEGAGTPAAVAEAVGAEVAQTNLEAEIVEGRKALSDAAAGTVRVAEMDRTH